MARFETANVLSIAERMDQGRTILGILGALFVLGGRAGLYGVTKIAVEPLSGASRANGIVYFLPKTTTVLEINYRVVQCDLEKRGTDEAAPVDVVIGVDVSITMSEKVEADSRHGYVIRSDTLSGALWRTEVTVETTNGLLKAINSTSATEVHVPEALKPEKVLSGLLSAARLTSQTAVADTLGLQDRRTAICGKKLVQALDKPESNVPTSNLATMRRVLYFDPSGDCPIDTIKSAAQPPSGIACIIDGPRTLGPLLADARPAADILQRYTIEARALWDVPTPFPNPVGEGIVYRMPANAIVQLCAPKCGGGRVLAEKAIVVPQFGPVGTFSIERRLFSDRTTQFEFGVWGELTKAKFIDAVTPPEKK
jgi:hypothetical protein